MARSFPDCQAAQNRSRTYGQLRNASNAIKRRDFRIKNIKIDQKKSTRIQVDLRHVQCFLDAFAHLADPEDGPDAHLPPGVLHHLVHLPLNSIHVTPEDPKAYEKLKRVKVSIALTRRLAMLYLS